MAKRQAEHGRAAADGLRRDLRVLPQPPALVGRVGGRDLGRPDRRAGQAGHLTEERAERRRHRWQVGPVGGMQADRHPAVTAYRRVANRTVAGRVVQRGNEHAMRSRPGRAGQPDSGPGRHQPGHGDRGRSPAQPQAAGPGGQAEQAQGGDGQPGQEHQPGDREIR